MFLQFITVAVDTKLYFQNYCLRGRISVEKDSLGCNQAANRSMTMFVIEQGHILKIRRQGPYELNYF